MPDINLNIRVSLDETAKETWDGTSVKGVVVKSAAEKRYTLTVAYPVLKADVGTARDGHRDFAGADALEECRSEEHTSEPSHSDSSRMPSSA